MNDLALIQELLDPSTTFEEALMMSGGARVQNGSLPAQDKVPPRQMPPRSVPRPRRINYGFYESVP